MIEMQAYQVLQTNEFECVTYLTHLYGLYPLATAIFRNLIYKFETLYIGNSKLIDTGPISFLEVIAVGFSNTIFVRS